MSRISVPPVPRINGCTNEHDIAGTFCNSFKGIYSNDKSSAHNDLKVEFENKFPDYFCEHIGDSLLPYYISWSEFIVVLEKLKKGKCSDSFIKSEHIIYGSNKLFVHLHLLYNGLIQHGFVPTSFLHRTISPIMKDSNGDISDTSNYRGVTLSSVFSKMFENVLKLKFGHYLTSDCRQFGFKQKHSTSHAAFTLKTCSDYFTDRGSDVYISFLDFSKAFDSISHYGLFSKLMSRGFPLCFLLIIVSWYLNMS
jgi:hypothetical protein